MGELNPKTERFAKSYDRLVKLGLDPRWALLYGKLERHVGKDGKCNPAWETLAEEIGVKDRTTVYRGLGVLKAWGLIGWKRRRRSSNQYRVYTVEVALTQRQREVLEVASTQPRKEYCRKEAVEENQSVSQPLSFMPETGWLADLLTGIWNHIPDEPDAELLARIVEQLGDAPRDELRKRLLSRGTKARSFGLALKLAVEARERWNAEAVERKQAAKAKTEDEIRAAQAIVADPTSTPEEKAHWEQWLKNAKGAA